MLIYPLGLVFGKGPWEQLVSVPQYLGLQLGRLGGWRTGIIWPHLLSWQGAVDIAVNWLLAWPPRCWFSLWQLEFPVNMVPGFQQQVLLENQPETVSSFIIWPQGSYYVTSAHCQGPCPNSTSLLLSGKSVKILLKEGHVYGRYRGLPWKTHLCSVRKEVYCALFLHSMLFPWPVCHGLATSPYFAEW